MCGRQVRPVTPRWGFCEPSPSPNPTLLSSERSAVQPRSFATLKLNALLALWSFQRLQALPQLASLLPLAISYDGSSQPAICWRNGLEEQVKPSAKGYPHPHGGEHSQVDVIGS